jgi:glutathione synthase/RimK-type ligase-like ATP-grasp enzyme
MGTVRKTRILMVFAKDAGVKSTRYGGFVQRVINNGGFKYAKVDYVALENLVFHIKNANEASVSDPVSGVNLSDYDFVYFKSWQSMPELAAAAAHYLEGMGIPYADHQVRHEYIAKTTNYMAMWAKGVSVPETIWGSDKQLRTYLELTEASRYPLIIKSVHGQKGKDNYLVTSKEEALSLIDNSSVSMLLQQFIPNGGDYRIGVYGAKARWGIYRTSGGNSHLNNVSTGGTATEINMKTLDPAIAKLAEMAAQAVDLSISGVDVVEDANTHELYVFEANQGSQIVTGAFTESNMKAFDMGIKALVGRRHKTKNHSSKRLKTIGRITPITVKVNDASIVMRAKIDTGAYQSALHAVDITTGTNDEGKEYVQYTVQDENDTNNSQTITTYSFGRATIKSSNGHLDDRFVVPITVEIGGEEYTTRVTLANRTEQKSPMLIGRQLLRGNFIVNPELGEVLL